MLERVPAWKSTPTPHVMVRCTYYSGNHVKHIIIKLYDLHLDPVNERERRVCLWESRLLWARMPWSWLLPIQQWGGLSFASSGIAHSKKSIACDQKVHKWPTVQSAGQQWDQTSAPPSQLNSVMVQLDQHIALSTSLINIRMDWNDTIWSFEYKHTIIYLQPNLDDYV